MIDSTELRALLALEEHSTVTAAARALGYTPSAVSQQLKRLEQKAGTALTRSVGRNLQLTATGCRLAREARRILTQWDDLEQAIRRLDGEPQGRVTVAGFPTGIRGLMIPAAVRLRSIAPKLALSVVETDVSPALDAVRSGRYDACLVLEWHGLTSPVPHDLSSNLVGTDRADLVVRRDHPIAAVGTVTPAQLVDEMWVTQPLETVCHGWFVHMFAEVGQVPKHTLVGGDYSTQLAMVDSLDAVALVPRMGVHVPPTLTRVPVCEPEPSRGIHLVSRRGFSGTPSHLALLDALIQQVADGGGANR